MRVVVPISDEGPWCGTPTTSMDSDSIDHAIAVAVDNDVRVFPITASSATAGAVAEALRLADGTLGTAFAADDPVADLHLAMEDVGTTACASV